MSDKTITLRVSAREFHTILAALHYYQVQCDPENRPPWMEKLASNGGKVQPLDAEEIDQLCQRINID
jgi:hypothetical protein